jgi:uncharacterized protein YkwD
MHPALFFSAALAVLASAKPLNKRDVVVEYVTEVQTVTEIVRVDAARPTPTPRRHRYQHVTVVTTVNAPAVTNVVRPATPPSSPTSEPPPPPPTSTKAEAPPVQSPQPEQPPPPTQSRATEHGGDYKQTVLDSHNNSRAKHGAPPLVWDDELFSITKQIAGSCKYAHDTKTGGGGYGQNIAAGAKASEIHKVIIDQFYSEVKYYQWYGREPDMSNFSQWGHFSALIWKDTTAVACWTEDCSGRPGKLAGVSGNVPPHFTVCNYRKPGNVGGQYAKNVLAPKY